jgi:hypothetical protein
MSGLDFFGKVWWYMIVKGLMNRTVNSNLCVHKFLLVCICLVIATSASAQDDQPALLLTAIEGNSTYMVSLDGTVERINVPDTRPVSSDEWTDAILSQFQPLSGPYTFAETPAGVIFTMTGEQDTYLNLYLLDDANTIKQLTFVERVTDGPIFSASAEFIGWRPVSDSEFLYRVRVQSLAGDDINRLYLHDIETNTDVEMPFFGKNPVWTPDGQQLIGGRLDDDEPPLYELWRVDITTEIETLIGPGCNPQFSPDKRFLAYDGHDNAQRHHYVDCFVNGEVYLFDFETGQSTLLTEAIHKRVRLMGWVGKSCTADSPGVCLVLDRNSLNQ